MTTRKEFEDALPELTEKIGCCKLCNRAHTYERKLSFGKVKWPSNRLSSCDQYKKMGVEERSKKMEELKGCAICTGW